MQPNDADGWWKGNEMSNEQPIEVEYGMDLAIVTFLDSRILEDHQIKTLKDAIDPVLEKNAEGETVLNFAEVTFMSSSMLGMLVRVQKRVSELGGSLRLFPASRGIGHDDLFAAPSIVDEVAGIVGSFLDGA